MSQPFGQNIRTACQALESGPQTANQLSKNVPGWNYEIASQYLQRAIWHGLATQEMSKQRIHRNFAYVYTIKPDWREMVDKFGPIKAKPIAAKKVAPKPIAPRPRQVIPPYTPPVPNFRNSIFDVREYVNCAA